MAPKAEPAGKVRHQKVDLPQQRKEMHADCCRWNKENTRPGGSRRHKRVERSEGGPQTARRRPRRSAKRDVGRSGAAGVANGVKRSERIRGQRPLKAEKQESQSINDWLSAS